jgi:hypothetical protein
MHIDHSISSSRTSHTRAEHQAWCRLWIRACREDLLAPRTTRDRARLTLSIHLLLQEISS